VVSKKQLLQRSSYAESLSQGQLHKEGCEDTTLMSTHEYLRSESMRVESDFLWLKGAMNAFWTSSSLLTVREEVEAPSVTRGSKAALAFFF